MQKIVTDWLFYLALLFGPLIWVSLTLFIDARVLAFAGLMELIQWAALIIFYLLLEELVFRGLILEWLGRRLAGQQLGIFTLANLLTSVLFVLAHLVYQDWIWAGLVFFPSMVFGYMKERHNSLISPIILHATYNLGFYFLFS